jgi:hypothetical protein
MTLPDRPETIILSPEFIEGIPRKIVLPELVEGIP